LRYIIKSPQNRSYLTDEQPPTKRRKIFRPQPNEGEDEENLAINQDEPVYPDGDWGMDWGAGLIFLVHIMIVEFKTLIQGTTVIWR